MNDFIHCFISLAVKSFTTTIVFVFQEIRRRIYSNETVIIHQVDLTQPIALREVSIPVTVRELQDSDIPGLLSLHEPAHNAVELRSRMERLLMIHAHIPTCYVILTAGGVPCGMCWLIDHTSNHKLRRHFNRGLMALKPGEVLCENIYTHQAYRGKHLMRDLTLKLFEKGIQEGAQKAFAYIHSWNKASLYQSKLIGWQPCGVKKIKWLLFRRNIEFDFDT